METQLISTQDLGYLRHNRAYANRHRNERRSHVVNPAAREFHKLLALLERDLIGWFGRLTNSKHERILRYKSSQGVFKYQEIDFIAENDDGLKFCELKLKTAFKPNMTDKESGYAQLNTTMEVASTSYALNGSLAICVDMEFLYTGKSVESTNYTSIEDLKVYLKASGKHELVWLDVQEILTLALSEGWFTYDRIDELREVYEMLNNPMSMLPESNVIPLNTPFAMLRTHVLAA